MDKINYADLTWVMISTALVMIMTPMLAFSTEDWYGKKIFYLS